MTNTIVLYYSNTGNNAYLAKKIAETLHCDIEELLPKNPRHPALLFSSWMGIGGRLKPVKNDLSQYSKVILCGPIWMGTFVAPMRRFIKDYKDQINALHFVTCCGSTEKDKDGRFGYNSVFKIVDNAFGKKDVEHTAIPIVLVVPDGLREDDQAVMEARLNDETFKGAFKEHFDEMISLMQEEAFV